MIWPPKESKTNELQLAIQKNGMNWVQFLFKKIA
jgi:hypothetical protein